MTTLLIILLAVAAIVLSIVLFYKNAKLKSTTIELDTANAMLESADSRNLSLKKEFDNETKKLNNAKAELAEFKKVSEEVKEGYDEMIKRLKDDIEGCQNERSNFERECTKLMKDKSDLLEKNKLLNESNDDLIKRINLLQSDIEAYESKIQFLEEENRTMKVLLTNNAVYTDEKHEEIEPEIVPEQKPIIKPFKRDKKKKR